MAIQHFGIPPRVNIDEVLEHAEHSRNVQDMADELRLVLDLADEREIYRTLHMGLTPWTARQIEDYLPEALVIEKRRRAK